MNYEEPDDIGWWDPDAPTEPDPCDCDCGVSRPDRSTGRNGEHHPQCASLVAQPEEEDER